DASVLYHSSSPKTAKQVHELGLQQIDRLTAEMKAIGERSFHTGDVPALLQRLRTDPQYRFKSREDKIAYSQAALARAKAAVPSRFGLLPKADVVITPYPAFREKNAPNENHPLGRYIFNSGYVEGWALYAETLADEMHLFSSDLDRLGMLSSQALRATRLVVDSGMHAFGWTRQQAIDYMLAHTAEPKDDVVSEIDRYIIAPGQATAYMLGQ